ncbi:hypothetical protein [Pontibacter rugosus]
MIGFVQLEREELPVLTELMDIENADGEGFFFNRVTTIVMAALFMTVDQNNALNSCADF